MVAARATPGTARSPPPSSKIVLATSFPRIPGSDTPFRTGRASAPPARDPDPVSVTARWIEGFNRLQPEKGIPPQDASEEEEPDDGTKQR